MTNGEKIKAMFPSMEVGFITDLQVGIYFVKNQHSATVFSLDWWNAEYKEPTTKNDLGVDCISRQDVLSEIIRFSTEEGASVECQQLYCDVNNMPPVTPIKPKGHWREVDTNMYACSKCSHVLTIDPLDNSILGMNTCPFCSAKMEGIVDDKGRSKTLVRNRTENVGR